MCVRFITKFDSINHTSNLEVHSSKRKHDIILNLLRIKEKVDESRITQLGNSSSKCYVNTLSAKTYDVHYDLKGLKEQFFGLMTKNQENL